MYFKKLIYNYPGCVPIMQSARYRLWLCRICWRIAHAQLFNTFIMILIIGNTVVLATDKYPLPEVDYIIETNQMFTIIFALECIIKLVGLTYNSWKGDIFNIFDLAIVIASVLELSISSKQTAIISALRALRLLRLIKLARSNFTLKCLLDSIAITIV